jgi:hypothetical protein
MARDEGAVGALAPGQRWSLSRKREVVLRLMQGEPVEGLSRRLGLPVYSRLYLLHPSCRRPFDS